MTVLDLAHHFQINFWLHIDALKFPN